MVYRDHNDIAASAESGAVIEGTVYRAIAICPTMDIDQDRTPSAISYCWCPYIQVQTVFTYFSQIGRKMIAARKCRSDRSAMSACLGSPRPKFQGIPDSSPKVAEEEEP
jgi:hypothetical protein